MSKYNKKPSFVLHKDAVSIVQEMTNDQAGQLFKAIVHFQLHNEEQDLEFALKMAFVPFKNQFIRDNKKYEEVCRKRREAANKRWNDQKEQDDTSGSKEDDLDANRYKCEENDANASNGKDLNANETNSMHSNPNNADRDRDSDIESESESGKGMEKEKDYPALEFLISKYPNRFRDEFLTPHKNSIQDYEKFQKKFNEAIISEGLEYSEDLIFERLKKYTHNWFYNQTKLALKKDFNSENSLSDKIPTA
ncbi:DUF6291 domain-containing protein [Salegentibacter mishustinae]|uniref:DUF6291 domain-containing protein n=1 Tax=Salegentibacter mishustinae TaxID=270918 RepID=UPI002490DA95|nr:DUF6291 domain-containing protein [Salegentibacter mishustinae]